jgi:hypothetical protein
MDIFFVFVVFVIQGIGLDTAEQEEVHHAWNSLRSLSFFEYYWVFDVLRFMMAVRLWLKMLKDLLWHLKYLRGFFHSR